MIYSGNYDSLNDEIKEGSISATLEKIRLNGTDSLWESMQGDLEGTFSVTVDPKGRYELCFHAHEEEERDDDTEENFFTEIPIGFNIRLQSLPRSLPDTELGPDAQRALSLVETAGLIQVDWQNLLDHFDFLRNREAVHSQLTKQIHDRVMGWTILEAVLVVAMALAQVAYWKKFFEQRRYL
jgi:emp24/gp25L/p24 family/GOLD